MDATLDVNAKHAMFVYSVDITDSCTVYSDKEIISTTMHALSNTTDEYHMHNIIHGNEVMGMK